ncbi:MAG: hypothetical protein HXS47_01160 [Theionarchaea archaeon]|nr:hypothetical protein [Theionarchaea archaeon]
MKKIICLLIACFLMVGGISVVLADTAVPDTEFPCPHDSGTGITPLGGGDDGGIGGGAGWPC